jgi:hypothetical protein
MLYTLEIVQFYHYFRTSGRARDDRNAIKVAVILLMILDTLATFASCATVYLVSTMRFALLCSLLTFPAVYCNILGYVCLI